MDTVVALQIDAFLIQEVWAPDALCSVIPRNYQYRFSETMGVGTGYVVGWRRAR